MLLLVFDCLRFAEFSQGFKNAGDRVCNDVNVKTVFLTRKNRIGVILTLT